MCDYKSCHSCSLCECVWACVCVSVHEWTLQFRKLFSYVSRIHHEIYGISTHPLNTHFDYLHDAYMHIIACSPDGLPTCFGLFARRHIWNLVCSHDSPHSLIILACTLAFAHEYFKSRVKKIRCQYSINISVWKFLSNSFKANFVWNKSYDVKVTWHLIAKQYIMIMILLFLLLLV